MRSITTAVWVLFFCGHLSSQNYFERYFDSGRDEIGYGITEFDNGNLGIIGFGSANGFTNGYYMLVDGTATPTFNYMNVPRRANLTRLASYSGTAAYLSGINTPTGTRDNWQIYELNQDGVVTPRISLGNFTADEEIYGLIALENGGFAGSGGYGTQNQGITIVFEADGTERWQSGFTADNSNFTYFFNLLEINTGFIAPGLKANSSSGNWSPFIVRYRNDGGIVWSFEYNLPPGEFMVTSSIPIVETLAGDIIASYVTVEDGRFSILILKINTNGDLIWSKKMTAAGSLTSLDLLDLGNDEYILGGYHRQTDQESAGILFRLDADGNIDWAKEYAPGQATQITRLAFHGAGDGLYAVGRSSPCSTEDRDVYLLSLDLEGNGLPGNCGPEELDFEIVDYPITRRSSGSQRALSIPVAPMVDFSAETGRVLERSCLFLDLDEDNSSGALAQNFQFDLGCIDVPLALHDLDLIFEGTFAGVDSLVFELVERTPTDSLFIIPGAAIVDNDQRQERVSITNLDQLTNEEARQLFQAIRYSGASGMPQQRRVVISAFSVCGEEVLAETIFSFSDEEMLVLDLGADVSICQGGIVVLDAGTTGVISYEWSTGADTSVIVVDTPGDYAVTLTSVCGNTLADSINVALVSSELIVLDTLIIHELCFGDSIELEAATLGADRYLWSDGETMDRRIVAQPGQLEVLVANACDSTRIIYQVSFQECCELYLPNTFSPNGDGINDGFRPFFALRGCAAISTTSLVVYDRWGGLVFEGDGIQEFWDGEVAGEPAGVGTYVYVFHYFNGIEMVSLSGNIMLLR